MNRIEHTTISFTGPAKPFGITGALHTGKKRVLATGSLLPTLGRDTVRFGTAGSLVIAPSVQPGIWADGHMAELKRRGVLVAGAAGFMGLPIAQSAKQAGFGVHLLDRDPLALQKAREHIDVQAEVAESQGHIKPFQMLEVRKAPITVLNLDQVNKLPEQGGYQPSEVPPAGLVIEAIFENLLAKQAFFRNMERLLPNNTILATNTSSLSVNEIAAGLADPENAKRFIGLHYFMPALTNRLVEVIPGNATSTETIEKTMKYARAIGKIPILIREDSPGFVANRLLITVAQAAMHAYQQGIADPKTIDDVAKRIFWPDGIGIPRAEKEMLPPFTLFERYGKLGVEISESMSRLGPFFHMPDVLATEHKRVTGLYRTVVAAAEDEYKQAQEAYYAQVSEQTVIESRLPLSEIKKGTESGARLDYQRQRLEKMKNELDALKREASYFSQGYPEPAGGYREMPEADRRKLVERILLGAYYGAARQMVVTEKLCTAADIENIAKLGFKWNIQPRSSDEIEASIQAVRDLVRERFGNEDKFAIPDTPLPTPEWITSTFNPKTGTQIITMNRVRSNLGQEHYNTLGTETLTALKQAVEAANDNAQVRNIVIEANGGKIFSEGADLIEVQERLKNGTAPELMHLGRDVMNTIAASKKPVIAKVQGDAYGGGVELALACDYIVASQEATFALPEVNLGIIPDWGGTERLPSKVGKPLAKALILGGKQRVANLKKFPGPVQFAFNRIFKLDMSAEGGYRLTAEDARKLGMAQVIVPRESLDDALEQLLAEGQFQEKPAAANNYNMSLEQYPHGFVERFNLANIEALTRQRLGRYNQVAWGLANRLIEQSDTPNAGKYSPAEAQAIIQQATARFNRMMQIVDMGTSDMKGRKGLSKLQFLKMFFTDHSSRRIQPEA